MPTEMMSDENQSNVSVKVSDHIGYLEFENPPHNFVSADFLGMIVSGLEQLDKNSDCRVVLLLGKGKSFCAGADFSGVPKGEDRPDSGAIYAQAMRLFRSRKPIVAAIQGAAIGAGLGLALAADFRIAAPEARFSANFNRLGFHPGFGLTYTLPRLIGRQQAAKLFYTGARIDGVHALAIGLIDELVEQEGLFDAAVALARNIAISAPLAVMSTRASLRGNLADEVEQWNQNELEIQKSHFLTEDFCEGISAASERRLPNFVGR